MTTSPVLLITGAGGGIGLATARRARAAGWRVVLVARSDLADLAADLGGPAAARAVVADVGDLTALRSAVHEAVTAFGALDAVFANAGLSAGPTSYRGEGSGLVDDPDVAGWRDMVLTNVLGVALTVRATADALVDSGGRLVVTGSVLGRYAMASSLYSATKFAVAGIAETVRLELAGTGVGVTLIEPGPVATGFAAGAARAGGVAALDGDDVARAVMFALSQPSGVEINELLLRPHGATP